MRSSSGSEAGFIAISEDALAAQMLQQHLNPNRGRSEPGLPQYPLGNFVDSAPRQLVQHLEGSPLAKATSTSAFAKNEARVRPTDPAPMML
jgi:hypothetical protein